MMVHVNVMAVLSFPRDAYPHATVALPATKIMDGWASAIAGLSFHIEL